MPPAPPLGNLDLSPFAVVPRFVDDAAHYVAAVRLDAEADVQLIEEIRLGGPVKVGSN
jgi:hypothetical protein